MLKRIGCLACLVAVSFVTAAQHNALPFPEAESQGLTKHLDSTYKSAIHADTAQAVFKSETEQEALINAYIMLLQDLGKFLANKHYAWEKQTRCFNRVYFNADGTIDYFLYSFTGKPEDQPSSEKQKEFQQLLSQFVQDYKIPLMAKAKFSQCSPAVYMPQKE